jgi:hypothetical protein
MIWSNVYWRFTVACDVTTHRFRIKEERQKWRHKKKLFFVSTSLKYNHNGMRNVEKIKNTETPGTLTNKEKESKNKNKK